jgi:hypothetical protein
MGILADLFVASADDAARYESLLGDRDAHLKKFSPAEYKGLTPVEFSTLWAIINSEPWDVDTHMLEEVAYGGGNESWLCRFPEPFVTVLASLETTETDGIAEAWSRTEELELSGFQASHTKPIVDDLVRLAKAAKSTEIGLYLWGSL